MGAPISARIPHEAAIADPPKSSARSHGGCRLMHETNIRTSPHMNLSGIVLVLFGLLAPGAHPAVAQDLGTIRGAEKIVQPASGAKLAVAVQDLIRGATPRSAPLVVVVESWPGRADRVAIGVERLGGAVRAAEGDLVEVEIVPALVQSIGVLVDVRSVRAPSPALPMGVTSQGVSLIGAAQWHAQGLRGSGTRIGVLDLGFEGYRGLLGTELPQQIGSRSFRSDGDIEADQPHGTAVAEIVHDVAPEADLFFANFETVNQMAQAVDWLIGQGVTVINASFGWLVDAPGDGTGEHADVVARARSRGVLWVNAAGNSGQLHWGGTFRDSDGDGWHEFSGSGDECNEIALTADDAIQVSLRWDDWQARQEDYDLYLYDSDTLTRLASSTEAQNGHQPPTESFGFRATSSGRVCIAIRRSRADRSVDFDLFVHRRGSPEPCAAETALIVNSSAQQASGTLADLRWLRSALLQARASDYVDLYTRRSAEIRQILLLHPGLALQVATFLRDYVSPAIASLRRREDPGTDLVSLETAAAAHDLKMAIAEHGSSDLQRDLEKLWQRLDLDRHVGNSIWNLAEDSGLEVPSTQAGSAEGLEFVTAARSIVIPADSAQAIAVGATDLADAFLPFSSQGPTVDGRIKPDLTGPSGVSTTTYTDVFHGTSASAPHVAGAIALLLAADVASAQVPTFLAANARPLGPAGKDNRFGDGRVALPAFPSAAIRISGPSSGDALQRLPFTATTSGCQADPLGWSWAGDATLFLDSVGASGTTGATATRGWILPGSHSVRVRNTRCGEGVATVEIRFPTRQETRLYPDTPQDLPNLPTVVFCHGLQPKNFNNRDLWSCVGECNRSEVDYPVSDLLDQSPGARNELQFVWSGAGQVSSIPDAGEYIRAWEFVEDAGRRLANALSSRLPANYSKPIQFVGHSLGSVVCGRAAAQFLKQANALDVTNAQLTVLDRPDHVDKLPGDSQFRDFEQQAFDAQFFPALLNRTMRPKLAFLLDNYWSSTGLGVGDSMSCLAGATVYNHRRPGHCPGCAAKFSGGLAHPNRIGNRYFGSESAAWVIDNDHSGVQQWYRWTMDTNGQITHDNRDAPVCNGEEFTPPLDEDGGPVFDGSLNPCEEGWNASIVGPAESVPNHDCDAVSVEEESILACLGAGGACSSQVPELRVESVSGALETAGPASSMPVDIPVYARNILFDLSATNPNSSLWAAVLLDSVPVWSGSLANFANNRAVQIGPVPLYALTGHRQLSLTILGPGNATLRLSNLRIQKILVPCAATDALCIAAHRFRVEAAWTDHNGNSGHATPRYVSTDESGFMWFFDSSNLELIVKVLNGCALNSRFWVFAAGLTDVGVRLTVTDTITGAIKIYHNPQGTAFAPIQDTDAFGTCRPNDIEAATEDWKPRIESEASDTTTVLAGARLNQGRFDVTASWRTASGTTGTGHLVAVTDDSGYLWFFDAANIEVAVKILDGCSLNSRYWVFAAGLTDVEVDLTVRDSRTGKIATYHSPLGQSFQPIQDTNALTTCP